jgi:hypothetical protein
MNYFCFHMFQIASQELQKFSSLHACEEHNFNKKFFDTGLIHVTLLVSGRVFETAELTCVHSVCSYPPRMLHKRFQLQIDICLLYKYGKHDAHNCIYGSYRNIANMITAFLLLIEI